MTRRKKQPDSTTDALIRKIGDDSAAGLQEAASLAAGKTYLWAVRRVDRTGPPFGLVWLGDAPTPREAARLAARRIGFGNIDRSVRAELGVGGYTYFFPLSSGLQLAATAATEAEEIEWAAVLKQQAGPETIQHPKRLPQSRLADCLRDMQEALWLNSCDGEEVWDREQAETVEPRVMLSTLVEILDSYGLGMPE